MFPDFYKQAPVIRTIDPLARFLGASKDGILVYHYEDAVRLAGHSCPTVASSFLATRLALKALYGDELPVRGEIEVRLAQAMDAGVTGVIGSITTLITGAATEGGFAGLAGQFSRRNRLRFGQSLNQGSIAFTRLDTGTSVELSIDLSQVPSDPEVGPLMQKGLSGSATEDELKGFASLWQERVRRLLLEHADDPLVFKVYQ